MAHNVFNLWSVFLWLNHILNCFSNAREREWPSMVILKKFQFCFNYDEILDVHVCLSVGLLYPHPVNSIGILTWNSIRNVYEFRWYVCNGICKRFDLTSYGVDWAWLNKNRQSDVHYYEISWIVIITLDSRVTPW